MSAETRDGPGCRKDTEMNTTASASTVQVTSDTGTLLRLLSRSFSTKHVVLAELLQNGRRAGATRIEVDVTPEAIVVRDNGCGIEDFSLLLSVVKSGWDEAVMREDTPYGCGFLGSLFVCDRLEVRSRGGLLAAATADLIDLKPVGLEIAPDTGMTEVRLEGHRIGDVNTVLNHLRTYAKGFPVPVVVNGQELPRPHALDALELIDTPIGRASPKIRMGAWPSKVYLQGLPVHVSGINGNAGDVVVHLDPRQFLGQAPDRSQLLDGDAAAETIKAALRAVAIEHVTGLARTMDPADFLTQHADLAASLGMRELLNSFDCIPASWVEEYDSAPMRMPPFYESNYARTPVLDGTTARVITREQLAARGIVLVSGHDRHGQNLLAKHAAQAYGFFVGASGLRTWHWAAEMARSIGPEDFEIVTTGERRTHDFEVWGEPAEVVLVETLAVKPREPLFGRTEPAEIEVHYNREAGELYVTAETAAWVAVRNVSDFVDENESYDEPSEDDYAGRLHLIVASLLHTDPAQLLQSLLREHVGHRMPEALKGNGFHVEIDAAGQITVRKPGTI